MSRVSISTYIATARKHLQQALRHRRSASFIIGNESADLDSIACVLVHGYVQSQAKINNEIVVPIVNIPASDLPLRPELTALLKHADLRPSDLITLDDLGQIPLQLQHADWTLVDHNALQGNLGVHYSGAVVGVIDHHDDEKKVPQNAQPRIIEKSGSCSSLVVNFCIASWDSISSNPAKGVVARVQEDKPTEDTTLHPTWDAQAAKIALGAILADTMNMKAEDKITGHDHKAFRYLRAKIAETGKDFDSDAFFEDINGAKGDLDSLPVSDILRKDYKQWNENGLGLGISSTVKPVEYLKSKADDLISLMLCFARERQLQLFAVMTAYTAESGKFSRQLLLLATENGSAVKVAEKFAEETAAELQLHDAGFPSDFLQSEGEMVAWLRVWDQKNVAASRKRVAPLLRETMR